MFNLLGLSHIALPHRRSGLAAYLEKEIDWLGGLSKSHGHSMLFLVICLFILYIQIVSSESINDISYYGSNNVNYTLFPHF